MQDLIYLALIWCSVFVSYWLANRSKLTPLLFYLVMGSLLVTVGLLPEKPSEFIAGFSEFGIILIMFALGFEENPNVFLHSIKRTWGIALFGALGPFSAAYFGALYLWSDQDAALLAGLVMTSTSVSLALVVLKFENLHLTKAASGIMTSAVLDNIASLTFVAILIPLVSGQEDLTMVDLLSIIAKAMVFFVIVVIFALFIFPGKESKSLFWSKSLFGRFGLNDALAFSDGKVATLVILTIAILSGILSHELGLHAAVGAYMAGLIMRKEYFYIHKHGTTINTYKKTRKIIDDVAFAWIGPIFFVNLGARLVLDSTIGWTRVSNTLLFTLIIFGAQTISAGLAARFTGKYNFYEATMIGLGMLGRAELAFVVIEIGYVNYQIFSREIFYSLMFTSFLLNICVPIGIKLWRPYFSAEKNLLNFKR